MKHLLILFLGINASCFLHAQNVGIGTSTPTARLQVVGQGSSSATNNLMLKNSSGDTLLKVLDNGKVGMGYNAASYGRTFSLGGNGMSFYYPGNGVLAGAIYPSVNRANSLEISATEHIILMATGYVGIRTYNPSVSLDVNGAIATGSQRTAFLGTNATVTLDVGNESFRILDNDNSVDKTIILSDGLADGQRLTILVRNYGTGTLIFIDNPAFNNTDIAAGTGSFVMSDDDTISFIWDAGAGYWVETGRSDN